MRQPKRAPALISNKPGTLSSVRWRREPTSGSTPLAYGPDREAHRREWVKVTRSLHDALEETLGFMQRALDRIQASEAVEPELHDVRAYLLTSLSCLGRSLRLRPRSSLAARIAVRACPGFSTVPIRVREESASIKGPGTSGASSPSRRASCCKPNSSVASSLRWLCTAVTRSMRRRAVNARLCPEIVNTNLATTIAVARFGPPPATAAQAPRHCGGTWLRKGGVKRVIMREPSRSDRRVVCHQQQRLDDRPLGVGQLVTARRAHQGSSQNLESLFASRRYAFMSW